MTFQNQFLPNFKEESSVVLWTIVDESGIMLGAGEEDVVEGADGENVASSEVTEFHPVAGSFLGKFSFGGPAKD